jgi:hypothetical protein
MQVTKHSSLPWELICLEGQKLHTGVSASTSERATGALPPLNFKGFFRGYPGTLASHLHPALLHTVFTPLPLVATLFLLHDCLHGCRLSVLSFLLLLRTVVLSRSKVETAADSIFLRHS